MGRGNSGAGGGTGGGSALIIKDFDEAFMPGKDFVAVGGVNHSDVRVGNLAARGVSQTTQREWDAFATPMQNGVTSKDEALIMRDWSTTPNAAGNYVKGYVRTGNSFEINRALYDPANANKPISKIFKRKADRDTVRALDKAIDNNTTQKDASYTRFSGTNGIQATFGLTNQQMQLLSQASSMTPAQLRKLNKTLNGTTSFSKSYTSTSGNRTLNAFSAFPYDLTKESLMCQRVLKHMHRETRRRAKLFLAED